MEFVTKMMKISELKAADYNPRRLTDKQFKDLRQSMSTFGATQPAVINSYPGRENVIIGGHQRVKVWASLGRSEYPCWLVSLDPDKERELNIRLNQNMGEWDKEMLANLFATDDLMEWGFDSVSLGMGLPGENEEEAEAKPKKTKTCPHCGEVIP